MVGASMLSEREAVSIRPWKNGATPPDAAPKVNLCVPLRSNRARKGSAATPCEETLLAELARDAVAVPTVEIDRGERAAVSRGERQLNALSGRSKTVRRPQAKRGARSVGATEADGTGMGQDTPLRDAGPAILRL